MTLFIGDIHGNFVDICNKMDRIDLSDCNIVQVGDFGAFNANEKKIEALNEFLRNRNIKMYAIRGNHDDPFYFDGTVKMSNLELVPDYSVLELDGDRILCIGGAISVDRVERMERGFHYFRDEYIFFNPLIIESVTDINILVTHTAPDFCNPIPNYSSDFIQTHAKNDINLISELYSERKMMTEIFETLSIKNNIERHFYGHFHNSYVETINGCAHRLLNIDEIF